MGQSLAARRELLSRAILTNLRDPSAHDDQVDAMTQALLRWHEVPKQQTYVSYCDIVQISPV